MKKITFLVFSLLILFAPKLSAQEDAKFQAIFLYNFIRQMEWPADYKQGDVLVKVIGDSEIIDELNAYAKEIPINNQKIICQSSTVANLSKCHIVYIPVSKSTELAAVIAKIGNASTLIVTEQAGLTAKGAGISFVRDNENGLNVLRYQYNEANITKQKIKVGSGLKELGIPK